MVVERISLISSWLRTLLRRPLGWPGALCSLALLGFSFSATANETTNVTAELALLTLTNTAPGLEGTLTYDLIQAPAGATADTNGVIKWTPTEAQGPGTNMLVMVVSDAVESITNTFVVMVTEVNVPPVAVADSFAVTNSALTIGAPGVLANDTDADLPANTLTAHLL